MPAWSWFHSRSHETIAISAAFFNGSSAESVNTTVRQEDEPERLSQRAHSGRDDGMGGEVHAVPAGDVRDPLARLHASGGAALERRFATPAGGGTSRGPWVPVT